MTKRLFPLLLMLVLPLAAGAQSLKFGYFSYSTVLHSMDDYTIAMRDVSELRNQYTAEAKRSEDDFNAKYESFLDEQSGLDANIRNKRQAELLDLMEKNTAFKAEAEKLIRDAGQKATDSLSAVINAAVMELGRERGYAFIINTDNNSLPFANPALGDDVTAALEERLTRK